MFTSLSNDKTYTREKNIFCEKNIFLIMKKKTL